MDVRTGRVAGHAQAEQAQAQEEFLHRGSFSGPRGAAGLSIGGLIVRLEVSAFQPSDSMGPWGKDSSAYATRNFETGARGELDVHTPLDDPRDESEELDLHGLSVVEALRRVAQALHAARVRGRTQILIITGAGWGNADQRPVLRPKVEAWLRGPEGRAMGVKEVRRARGEGALVVNLR
jgi:hypothetical protein